MEYADYWMGYESAGGLGVKMAEPEREVYGMVGDGCCMMMAEEVVTSIQEGYKLTIVLLDNGGFSSIGGLSQAVGSGGFGTVYRERNPHTGQLDGEPLPVDLGANAASLGARLLRVDTLDELQAALAVARQEERTTVIYVPTDREQRVPGYESWWDVPVAEVSEVEEVRQARAEHERALARERVFLGSGGWGH